MFLFRPSFCKPALCALLFAIALRTAPAQQKEPKPMAPQAHPKFEVAAIKLTEPGHKGQGFHTSGIRLYIENETMEDLLSLAYGINRKQIANAPDWFSTTRFDIQGAADVPGIPSVPQQAEMVRGLLEERFALKLHHDQREMTRILVTVARGGPKFSPTKSIEYLPDETCNGDGGNVIECRFTAVPMEGFAELLRYFLDRPIVDQTGLTGRYDFILKWARQDAPANPDTAAVSVPGLFTAMQEQIGLKAESSKGPTEVLIIEHAEKPSDN